MSATEARLELLLPQEIRARLDDRAVVYLPLGTIEWHCEHLPVGLDALTAHGICLRAATRDGGLVFPALYYGAGGGHSLYPWTVMMETDREIAAEVRKTLARLQDFGVQLAVLFSGHFADGQLAMIDEIAETWQAAGNPMKVIATAVNRIEGLPFGPDHAGIFETTLLGGLLPDRVQVDRLPSIKIDPLAPGDFWEEGRHDPKHPLWGIVGPDPRAYDARQGPPLVAASVEWLIARVRRELGES
jgi:creatinine amidohydrolase